MPTIVDYGTFHTRLAAATTTADRWRLLDAFQREWGIEVEDEEGIGWIDDNRERLAELRDDPSSYDEEEDDDFEHVDLTLGVPGALDEWWNLPFNSFVANPRHYWTHPVYPPSTEPGGGDDIELKPGLFGTTDLRVCRFMAEYQYCNEWGYAAAHADRFDPPALVTADWRWQVQGRSLSEFFLLLAVIRLPRYTGWRAVPESVVAPDAFPALGFLPWRELGGNITVHGAPDALIYYDTAASSDEPLAVAARTREALDGVAGRLGVTWKETAAPRYPAGGAGAG
jgi:hypothetical protein